MTEYVFIYEVKVDAREDQPTGLLHPNGKAIVKLPPRVGFTAEHSTQYAVRDAKK